MRSAPANGRSAGTPTMSADPVRRPSPAKLRAIARAAAASRVMAQKVNERLAASRSSTPRRSKHHSHGTARVPKVEPSPVARQRSPRSIVSSATRESPNYAYFASVLGHCQVALPGLAQSPSSSPVPGPSSNSSPDLHRHPALSPDVSPWQSVSPNLDSSKNFVGIGDTNTHSSPLPPASSVRCNASLHSPASRELGRSRASRSSPVGSDDFGDRRPTVSPPAMQTTQAMVRQNVPHHVATPTAARPREAHVRRRLSNELGHGTPPPCVSATELLPTADPAQKSIECRGASFSQSGDENTAMWTPPLSVEAEFISEPAPTPEAAPSPGAAPVSELDRGFNPEPGPGLGPLPLVPRQVQEQEPEPKPAREQELKPEAEVEAEAGHPSSVHSGSDSDIFFDAEEGSSCSPVASPARKALSRPATQAGRTTTREPDRGQRPEAEVDTDSGTELALELDPAGESGHKPTALHADVTDEVEDVHDDAHFGFASISSVVAAAPSRATSSRALYDQQLHYRIARSVSLAAAPTWYREETQKMLLTDKVMQATAGGSQDCDTGQGNTSDLYQLQNLTPTRAKTKRLLFEPPRWFKEAQRQKCENTLPVKADGQHRSSDGATSNDTSPAKSAQQFGELERLKVDVVQTAAKAAVSTGSDGEVEVEVESGAEAGANGDAEAEHGALAESDAAAEVVAVAEVEAQGEIQKLPRTIISAASRSSPATPFSVIAHEEADRGVEWGTSHHEGDMNADIGADLVMSRALAACEASARLLCCSDNDTKQQIAAPEGTERVQQRRLASALLCKTEPDSARLGTSAATCEKQPTAACAQTQKPAKRHPSMVFRSKQDKAKSSKQRGRPDREDGGLPRSWRQQHKHKHRRWLQRWQLRGSFRIGVGAVAERKASAFAKSRDRQLQRNIESDGPAVEWIVLPHAHSRQISARAEGDAEIESAHDNAPRAEAHDSEPRTAAMAAAVAATVARSAALAANGAATVAGAVISSVAASRASQAAALACASAAAGVAAALEAVAAAKVARMSLLESAARAAAHAALVAARGADTAMGAAANAASMIAATVAVAAAASVAAKADSASLLATASGATLPPASDAVEAALGYLRARANSALANLSGAVKAQHACATEQAERLAPAPEGLGQALDQSVLPTTESTGQCALASPSVPSLSSPPPAAPALDPEHLERSAVSLSIGHGTHPHADTLQQRVQHQLDDLQTQQQRQFQQLWEQQARIIQYQRQQQDHQIARDRPIESPVARAAPQVAERGTQASLEANPVIAARAHVAGTRVQTPGLQAAEDPKHLLRALQGGEAEVPRDCGHFLPPTTAAPDESDGGNYEPLAFAPYEPLEDEISCDPMTFPALQSNCILLRWSRCGDPSANAVHAGATRDDELLSSLRSMYLLRSGAAED